ncbi:MAG: hypothetical protein NWR73_00145, partial [Flavobacteriales bacterium]|nr:hypothetical protein [Flavobacteriales bacterium]
MTRNLIAFLIATVLSVGLFAQTIGGDLTALANQPIELYGFDGLNAYPISNTVTDNRGSFKLNYTASDFGIGYLLSSDNSPLFVVLTGENIELEGNALKQIETIRITHGQENQWFEQYAYEHSRREQALSGWLYLEKIYEIDTVLSQHSKPKEAIQAEKQRLNDEDSNFLSSLPKDSYVSWYLPVRKLISSASSAVKQDEVATLLTGFRGIVYSDSKLYKSGLLKEAIDNHFGLIENSGLPLDSVYLEMQISIDGIIEYLMGDEQKLNEITNYLFDLLERHSLFQASEYLALKVLNEVSCTIESGLANQLETYRAMKKGNIAADILFKGDNFTPGYGPANFPRKLSDINSDYTLVVFGASW